MLDERNERPAPTDDASACPDDLTFEVTDLTTGASQTLPMGSAPATNGDDAQRPNQGTPLMRVSHRQGQVILTLDVRALRIGIAALALLVVATIVFGNLLHLSLNPFVFTPPATPTPYIVSQSNTSFGAITTLPPQTLKSIPQDCSPDRTIQGLGTPSWGTAAGYYPVWVDAFDGSTATLSIPAHGDSQFTQYGWQVIIMLVIANSYKGSVTLNGHALTTNYPLWFGALYPPVDSSVVSQTPTAVFSIDARQAESNGGGASGSMVIFPIALYLPGADCYHLSANWPGGGWQITFAAGA